MAFDSVKEAIKLIKKISPYYLSVGFISGGMDALCYYMPVLLLAQILDGIEKKLSVKSLLTMAVIGVLVIFAISIVRIYCKKNLHIQSEFLAQYFESLIARKNLKMDYALLESPEMQEVRGRIRTDRSWGSGLYGVTMRIQNVCTNVMGALISICAMLPLLIRSLREGNVWLIIAVIISLLISAGISVFFVRWYERKETEGFNLMTQSELKSRFHVMNEGGGMVSYRDIKDIQIYGAFDMIENTIIEESKIVKRHSEALSKLGAFNGIIKGGGNAILLIISYGAVLICAALKQVTVGFVTQYAQSIFKLTESVASLLQEYAYLKVDSERLCSTMEYLKVDDGNKDEGYRVPIKGVHCIEFENVSFSYPNSEIAAIKNLTLKLNTKNKTAIVGLNGSGKTTLIKLLCRLYVPDEGRILLDGIDIREYEETHYKELFSTVFQDFHLFSFQLGMVVSASENYNDEHVYNALNTVGYDAVDGLKTAIYKDYEYDGREISGGEAQKIAIARAIYRDADIVILDEPTAALDPAAEFELFSNFNNLMGNKGVIYISHRLSSCYFCDEIIVIDKGEVLEKGEHHELIKAGGLYAKLWKTQAQYYNS